MQEQRDIFRWQTHFYLSFEDASNAPHPRPWSGGAPRRRNWCPLAGGRPWSSAQKNAKQNYLDINFKNVDILKKHDHTIKFDIIVSNPPYVHKKEKNLISNVVLKNEPSEAIFVNSNDDLLFYKTIINFSKLHLKQKGIIYFECHKETINQVKNLLIINKFTDIEIKKDSFGINRMIKANNYGDA